MIGGILDGHHLVLSVRTIEPVALSRRHISLIQILQVGFPFDQSTSPLALPAKIRVCFIHKRNFCLPLNPALVLTRKIDYNRL